MCIRDRFKDVLSVAQKADNIDLYRKLLDLSAQALEMQDEITQLKQENAELKKYKDIEAKIVRHDQPFISLAGEDSDVLYCATCWGMEKKLIQVKCNCNNGEFKCPKCETEGVYNKEANEENRKKQLQAIRNMYSSN